MSNTDKIARQKAKQLAGLLNLVINLFWTFLCLGPVVFYIYLHLPTGSLWMILPIFLLPYCVPASWLDGLTASKSGRWYERMGVPILLEYVQQGRLIHRIVRRYYPGYRMVYDKATIRQKIKETYAFERFHYGILLVLMILTGHTLKDHWQWTWVMIGCNIIYNVYPVLLQQYVRLRLSRIL